jgi:hypothetical protein
MVTGIDHPIIAVRDMSVARDAYQRLGFTVTPRGRHLEWGTGNWCIMFERDYLELRGIIDPANTHDLGSFLAKREGLMGVAFGTDDAQASCEALMARGLRPQPVRQLARDFELPEGSVQPRFSLCFVNSADAPGLMSVVLCQHLTPELLRRSDWLHHANGTYGVRRVASVASDLDAAADCHAKLFGRQAISQERNKLEIQIGAGQTISLMSPEAARQDWPEADLSTCGKVGCLLGVTLAVKELSATQRYLASQAIECRRSAAGSLRISPKDACGAPLEFTDRD